MVLQADPEEWGKLDFGGDNNIRPSSWDSMGIRRNGKKGIMGRIQGYERGTGKEKVIIDKRVFGWLKITHGCFTCVHRVRLI